MMKKLVINEDYGGFSVSAKAMKLYAELKGITLFPFKWDYSKRSIAVPVSWEDALKPERRISDIISFSTQPIEDGKVSHDDNFNYRIFKRDDPILVRVVEQLGAEANGACASLKIVEIPDDVSWEIEDYDGLEWVSEIHRSWR